MISGLSLHSLFQLAANPLTRSIFFPNAMKLAMGMLFKVAV